MTQQLDRIITIQQRTVTRDQLRRRRGDMGWPGPGICAVQAPVGWRAVREQRQHHGRQQHGGLPHPVPRRPSTETMRVVHDGHEWDIEGIVEVGRRDKLDVIATRS